MRTPVDESIIVVAIVETPTNKKETAKSQKSKHPVMMDAKGKPIYHGAMIHFLGELVPMSTGKMRCRAGWAWYTDHGVRMICLDERGVMFDNGLLWEYDSGPMCDCVAI